MPKKLNFLGGMQNYNPENGEYEPALQGPNGESPSNFKSFKKPKSEFEKAVDKKLGKKSQEDKDYVVSEYNSNVKVKKEMFDKWQDEVGWEDDAEKIYNFVQKGGYSKDELNSLKKYLEEANYHESAKLIDDAWWEDYKKPEEKKEENIEFKLDKKKYPDVTQSAYGYIYNVNGKSITDLAGEKKKLGYSLSTKDSGFTVAVGGEEVFFKDFDSAYKYAKGEDKEPKFEKPQGFDSDQEEFDYNYDAAKKLNNYEQAEKLKGMLAKNYGENSNAVKGVQKALDEMKANFDKGNKEKTLDDYTDELFKKTKLKTFTSKKYKNPQGEIVEIRRFGEGKDAIRYNETKKEVEQVWIDGERVK